jgi:hypothetical protein
MKYKYTISFILDGKKPTKGQMEYYLDYWLGEDGNFIENLSMKIVAKRKKK